MSEDTLLAILGELKKLNAALRPRFRRHDYSLLQKLLPPIAGHFGSGFFTAREISQDPALQSIVAGLNVKQIGNLLSRAVNVDCEGLTVQASKTENGLTLWNVEKVIR